MQCRSCWENTMCECLRVQSSSWRPTPSSGILGEWRNEPSRLRILFPLHNHVICPFSADKQLEPKAYCMFLCVQLWLPDSGLWHHADQALPPSGGDWVSCTHPIAHWVPIGGVPLLCVGLGQHRLGWRGWVDGFMRFVDSCKDTDTNTVLSYKIIYLLKMSQSFLWLALFCPLQWTCPHVCSVWMCP